MPMGVRGKPLRVRVYDFRRPDKFSKDQMRTVEMLYGHVARLCTTYFSGYLRGTVQFNVLSVEQSTYGEFLSTVSTPSIIGIVGLPPLKGKILLVTDPIIAFAMLDRLLGGSGGVPERVRPLTEIEQTVMQRVLTGLLANLADGWRGIVDLTPSLDSMESNPLFAQVVAPNEMVLTVTLEVRLGAQRGQVYFCMPYLLLEPVLPKLSPQQWLLVQQGATAATGEESERQLELEVGEVPVELSVTLGSTRLTLRELLTLEVGDVLRLQAPVKGELTVQVEGICRFRGRPGTLHRHLAVRVTAVQEEEEEVEAGG